jgi:rhodanese-related sulfurtransferase
MRKSYDDLIKDALLRVREILPWDLRRQMDAGDELLLVDVRESDEFARLHIPGSMNVPRGILEQSCEWDYEETQPRLAAGHHLKVVVICRSGKRSVLAADVMQQMGFVDVVSLRTGVRGWNDYEQPLSDFEGRSLTPDEGDELLASNLRSDQRAPKRQ